jgi:basic membrane protein A
MNSMNPIKKNIIRGFHLIICAAFFFFVGCKGAAWNAWQSGKPFPKEKIKIGVIYISDAKTETSGYTYAHKLGIEEMRKRLNLSADQLIERSNVYDTDASLVESSIRDCIAMGANVIIATSWGYMEACEKLAAEFPHVVFAHATGYKSNDTNFTNYFGRVYQARYLSGIAAGLKTQSGKIGYVAAQGRDNSEVTGGLNAFALGVERVNPNARIYVGVTHSWFDPMGETDAAKHLLGLGCDVLAQHCDSEHPQTEAEKAGAWGIGYNSDMRQLAPGAVLTSVIWHWGIYYAYLIESVINGSFTTKPWFGSIDDGIADITGLSSIAEPGTAERIAEERRRIEQGFNVFDGPLRTNDNRIIGREGATLSDAEITGGINWYYHTVIE